ncbi:MAG: cytochrome c biogenesis protein [Planctomycetota bacterium]|jgi:ABC-type transport system involved in cytochrome c biogenesis permease subunit
MLRASLILLTALAIVPGAYANESTGRAPISPDQLPIPTITKATLDAADHIPVQDQGRVKPLSTFAAFTLLNLHHKRKFELPDERKIKPTEWYLRTVLFPRRAMDDKVIRIEDSDVLDDIGMSALKAKKKKRDLYSYNELSPGRRRLVDKYSQYMKTDSRKQTRDQKRLVTLAHKVFTFENLLSTFMFAEMGVAARTPEQLEQFGGREQVPLSVALDKLNAVVKSGGNPEWSKGIAQMADMAGRRSGPLRIMAPLKAEDGLRTDWLSVGDIVGSIFASDPAAAANIEYLAKLEAVFAARQNSADLEKAFVALQTDARARAESSNAYEKIGLEVYYHRFDAFSKALVVFLLSFLVLAASWLRPQNKWIMRSLWALVIIGAGLITYGIVLRCILRGRPPVSTLYETILFITGTGVISALVIEWINKRRVGIAAAVILGALGLFIAGKYEEIDRQDTMPQLLAVLDTNFWLATHVTCITIGYAAGLLAAALAHVYVLGKAFRFKKNDPEFYRGVARMVYGTLAFSLVFSVVGTILGGVWANDSWGRFWGWDPKENGALMIVLSQIAIIHARMGGYIKNFGVSMCAILGGMIIAFSWWHVNQLGIGLHAYGFTEGLLQALYTFYTVESLIFVFAGSIWLYEKYFTTPKTTA